MEVETAHMRGCEGVYPIHHSGVVCPSRSAPNVSHAKGHVQRRVLDKYQCVRKFVLVTSYMHTRILRFEADRSVNSRCVLAVPRQMSLMQKVRPGVASWISTSVPYWSRHTERELPIDNLLVRIHLIIETNLVDRPCAIGV